MENIDFNALRDRAYKCSCEHGFHNETLSDKHFLMLVITKLSEAVEADRKGKYCTKHGKFVVSKKEAFENRGESDEFDFKTDFKELIKDSVEDKLADAVIRLLGFSSLREYDIHSLMHHIDRKINNLQEMKYYYDNDISFIEKIFFIVYRISDFDPIYTENTIYRVIGEIFCLSKAMDIDLLWHIEQKMKYNELRPYKNGKKY